MTIFKKALSTALVLLPLVGGILPSAKAQIAYIPEVGFVPTGATMTVTPVVSADRRYVRLGVDAFFNNFNFFSTFTFPSAAVGGGNFGGLGAGVIAGMDGVIGDEGYQSGVQVGNNVNARAQPNPMRAGPLPDASGPSLDSLFPDSGMNQGNAFGLMPGFEADEAALMLGLDNRPARSARAAGSDRAKSPRRSSTRKTAKPTRKQSTARRNSSQ
jgi:hypothetical protein